MREMKKRRELHNLEWEELIAEAESDDEKKHVYPVIWKFCDLDIKPHDKHVSHHELIPITAPVIPMESCIKPFLENCDVNNDGNISIMEWGKCLGLKEGWFFVFMICYHIIIAKKNYSMIYCLLTNYLNYQ